MGRSFPLLAWLAAAMIVGPVLGQTPDAGLTNQDKAKAAVLLPAAELYHEVLRPQYHFSAAEGWLNDPNGLIYYDGRYQLFFQHDPASRRPEKQHWGHAISTDLVHWTQLAEALSPDPDGNMWSGSAVLDRPNSSGFGELGRAPLVLIYTKAPNRDVSLGETSLAYSSDGLNFSKYGGNPVIGDLKLTNRDPRVFWYAPGGSWVLVLYVEENGRHNVRFYTSADLRRWTLGSEFAGGAGDDHFLFECPDFWEMPVEGEPLERRWVLTAANTEYMVGSFDGKSFTPETAKLPGQAGTGYYAPQTFTDEPRGRRVRMGWFQTEAPGMPFTQSMSLPSEHKLVRTPAGLRLTWAPVEELKSLRGQTYLEGARTLTPGESNPLGQVDTDLLEIRATFVPGKAGSATFVIRGVPVSYDAGRAVLSVGDRQVSLSPAAVAGAKMSIIIYADRLSLEVYANDGLTYVPYPVEFREEDRSAAVKVEGGPVEFEALDVYRLQSAWGK